MASALLGQRSVGGMNLGERLITDMRRLVSLFAPRCDDLQTMSMLAQLLGDQAQWPKALDLCDRIRDKARLAASERNRALAIQYSFEGLCARALYDLWDASADSGASYWIVPNAFALSRTLGIDDAHVLDIVRDR